MNTTTITQNLNAIAANELTRIAVHAAEWQLGIHTHNPHFLLFNPRTLDDYAADIELARKITEMGDDERGTLFARLKITRHAHLLEPDQKLGNKTVIVPDAEYTEEQVGLILSTQVDLLLLDLEQPAVFDKFKDERVDYLVTRHGVTQLISMVPTTRFLYFSAVTGDEFEAKMWGFRTSFGGSSSYENDPVNKRFPEAANLHLERCLMADEASKNERLAPHYDTFKELDLEKRTVKVEADGQEVALDFSGDELVIKDSNRKPLPTMMAEGFLKQFAKSISYRSGAGAMNRDLRKVFVNAAARLAK